MEFHVYGRTLGYHEMHAGAGFLSKSGFLGANFVISDGEGKELIVALGVGIGVASYTGIDISCSYRSGGDYGAGLVADGAGEDGGDLGVRCDEKERPEDRA